MSHPSSSGLSSRAVCGPEVHVIPAFDLCTFYLDCPPGSLSQTLPRLCPQPLGLSPNTDVPQKSSSVHSGCHAVWTNLRSQFLKVPTFPGF